MADAGNLLIDALVMRDPGSYADIVDILADEGVLCGATAASARRLVLLRRVLLQDYAEDRDGEILACARLWPDFLSLAAEVRRYAGM